MATGVVTRWGWLSMGTGRSGDLEDRSAGDAAGGTDIAVAGAHGGAGVSTLAVLLGSERDLGVVPRHSSDWLAVRVEGRPLVLVSRNTLAGAVSVTSAIEVIEGLGGTIAALAVVRDGPELTAATHRFQALASHVGGIVRIPFVPVLRAADDPAHVILPKAALQALAELRALTTACAAADQPTRPEGA